MSSSDKKALDRISLLPDSLLHRILSFLNTRQVVQTCVLSKRWNPLWTRTQTLNFDFDSYPFKWSIRNARYTKEKSFKRFVFRFSSEHHSKCVRKLSYSSTGNSDGAVVAKLLICYAQCHMVEEIYIKANDAVDWMSCLSTCRSLAELKISCGILDDLASLMLPCLRTLVIESGDVHLMDQETFSGCPNLKCLALIDYEFVSACICAPKLKTFEISASSDWEVTFPQVKLLTPNLKSVKFKNVIPFVDSASDLLCTSKVHIAIIS